MLGVEHQSAQMSKITNNPVWQRMLHSCTDMATVGVKGLTCMQWQLYCVSVHVQHQHQAGQGGLEVRLSGEEMAELLLQPILLI